MAGRDDMRYTGGKQTGRLELYICQTPARELAREFKSSPTRLSELHVLSGVASAEEGTSD